MARKDEKMKLIQESKPKFKKDKYCPICCRRLAFLRFVAEVRDSHSFNKLFAIKEKNHVQLS